MHVDFLSLHCRLEIMLEVIQLVLYPMKNIVQPRRCRIDRLRRQLIGRGREMRSTWSSKAGGG